jgi:competence protein ComEC
LFCALVAGVFYFHIYLALKDSHTNLPLGKKVSLVGIIVDEPKPSEKYLLLEMKAEAPLAGRVVVLARQGSDFHYGDEVRAIGTINKSDDGGEPIMFSPEIIKIAGHKGFWLREKMINLKLAIEEHFNLILPSDQAAFLGGILFGSKTGISAADKIALSLSGTTHLIAVSGYKVTLVIFGAGILFGRFFSRRATFFFALLFLILFIAMVGTEASAVRAAIMGFLALLAREMGEAFNIRNALIFTALFMALIDPTILTGDLSFIISFASVLGIIYLGPAFKKLFRYSDEGLLGWREAAITTLAAQLATMPVLMNAFGQFSLMAIPANVLTLSLLPITMFFGSLLAFLGFVSSHLAFFVAKLTGFILAYQLSAIRFFARLATPLPLPFNSAFAIFFYYLLIATFAFSYGADQKV